MNSKFLLRSSFLKAWFFVSLIFSTILDIITVGRQSTFEKDLEIVVLRQQLMILQRKINSPVKPTQIEKLTISILTLKLKRLTNRTTNQLKSVIRIFQPETVLRWHRELVRKKWTYQRKDKGGRPSINKELENLVIQLAQDNPRWGYGKIQGELIKLNFHIYFTSDPVGHFSIDFNGGKGILFFYRRADLLIGTGET